MPISLARVAFAGNGAGSCRGDRENIRDSEEEKEVREESHSDLVAKSRGCMGIMGEEMDKAGGRNIMMAWDAI